VTTEVGHTPVLIHEVIQSLNIRSDGAYLDATGGGGGHSQEILNHLSKAGRLTICDYHEPSVARLKDRFTNLENVTVIHERFSRVFEIDEGPFDGILADFGISSPQLEDKSIGIGFQQEGAPLDMRIDKRLQATASDILKSYEEEALANLFYEFGGERFSRKIAAAIVYDRNIGKFYETTEALKGLCERVLSKHYRSAKIHPATKVFQALRIAVNNELKEVADFLEAAPERLKVGGRLALISFHEGEDRQVKVKFKELAQKREFFLVTKKAMRPGDGEILANPRSRSARLRVLERREVAL